MRLLPWLLCSLNKGKYLSNFIQEIIDRNFTVQKHFVCTVAQQFFMCYKLLQNLISAKSIPRCM